MRMNQNITIRMTSARTFEIEGGKQADKLNPKELLLLAGATCAGMTAMSILEKQRIPGAQLEIEFSGELSTEQLQSDSVFVSFRIVYRASCTCDNQEKVSRAITLAHDKYCGGVKMLGAIAPVEREISIVTRS